MNLQGVWAYYDSNNCPLPTGSFIDQLTNGPGGQMWIGVGQSIMEQGETWGTSSTRNLGILRYQNGSWAFFGLGKGGLPDMNISRMGTDAEGRLWLSMVESPNTLYWFNGRKGTTINAGELGLPSQLVLVSAFSADLAGGFWVVSDLGGGACRFDGETWQSFNTENSSLPSNNIQFVTVDFIGRVWFAVLRDQQIHLVWYKENRWTEYTVLPRLKGEVQALTLDHENRLWLGLSDRSGLWCLPNPKAAWIRYTQGNSALPDDSIRSLVVDTSGRTWAAASGGLAIFQGGESVCWNAILPGTQHGPLNLHSEDISISRRRGDDPAYTYVGNDLAIDSFGHIWASSGFGVSVFFEA
jgi:ligand-binding sensor domain-containing protein